MSPIMRSRPARRARPFIAVALAGLCLCALYYLQPFCGTTTDRWRTGIPTTQDAPVRTNNKLVSLEAHIISKCPDTRASSCYTIALRFYRRKRGLTAGHSIGLPARDDTAGDATRTRQGQLHLVLYWQVRGLVYREQRSTFSRTAVRVLTTRHLDRPITTASTANTVRPNVRDPSRRTSGAIGLTLELA